MKHNMHLVVGKSKTRYLVEVDDEDIIMQAAIDIIRGKDPIYVGDFVDVDMDSRQIVKVFPRTNF